MGLITDLTKYYEMDMVDIVEKKMNIIKSSNLDDKNLKVLPCDLRNLEELKKCLSHLDGSLPTFVISECVLIYFQMLTQHFLFFLNKITI